MDSILVIKNGNDVNYYTTNPFNKGIHGINHIKDTSYFDVPVYHGKLNRNSFGGILEEYITNQMKHKRYNKTDYGERRVQVSVPKKSDKKALGGTKRGKINRKSTVLEYDDKPNRSGKTVPRNKYITIV